MTSELHLRDRVESDFPALFELQRDEASARMAAFGTKDSDARALSARWTSVQVEGVTTQKVIVVGDRVIGFVATFLLEGKLNVTYWIARSHWGRGLASAALSQLLAMVATRPLYASAAKDNAGSLRVLTKCGFVVRGSEWAFASARGEEVEEIFLQLD